jgi:crotonobetainyl-CoA:carnitine CoA-transferase CaiB-like acyl-CoA transferase
VVDVITGLQASVGILAALRHRDRTGVGQRIEVTLLAALQSALVNQASSVVGAGVVPGLLGNAHPSIAPYEVFATVDRPLVLAVGNDAQFARLVAVLGDPALADDVRFATNAARVVHRAELLEALESLLASAGADVWQARITAAGVPCGPINDIAQGLELADRLGLHPVVEVDDARRAGPQPQVANPVAYAQTPPTYRTAPPRVDEDRAEVLDLLGLGRP